MSLVELESLLAAATDDQRRAVFALLRDRYGLRIHPLEERWNTTAEAILDAIDQSADLTQRGIRGVLAEATFRTTVLPKRLTSWKPLPVVGDQPFDLMLDDGSGPVRVQVKLQRRESGVPKYHRKTTDHFVVETQRTRGGRRRDQEASRPYRVDEFDVLAVCLHPSTGSWTEFFYCATRDLLVRPTEPTLLAVMQPFPVAGSNAWSADFGNAVKRFRLGRDAFPSGIDKPVL